MLPIASPLSRQKKIPEINTELAAFSRRSIVLQKFVNHSNGFQTHQIVLFNLCIRFNAGT
jgi:hypothetical protein